MNIRIIPNTAGRYGGLLKGNLRYLSNFIAQQLVQDGFKSSFNELNITFAYPPMFVLPGVKGIENDFREYYESLPTSRVSRRYNKIDVVLQAPEISEHCDKRDAGNFSAQFKIEKQFQNLSNDYLATVVIDKILNAARIVSAKLKKEEFDFEGFEETLNTIRGNISEKFLDSLESEQEANVYKKSVELALQNRVSRSNSKKKADKLIRDIRVFHHGMPNKALYPYSLQYSEIFLNLLKRNNFKCPKYHHIYIQVAHSLNDALVNAFSFEDWHEYGVAIMDFEKYNSLNQDEKEKAVFKVICDGLRDIAKIDNLDMNILEKTISLVRETGLDTEFVLKVVEHKNYRLTITYYSRSMEEKCPIIFNLMEKATNKTFIAEVGRATDLQLDLWMHKINLTNKYITVRSSSSIRADVWLKDLPRELIFDISEIKNEWKSSNDN